MPERRSTASPATTTCAATAPGGAAGSPADRDPAQGPILARVAVDRIWDRATRTHGELVVYRSDTARGGHAVCLVGHTAHCFIVRNSWGAGWGDGGFAYAADDYG